MRTTLRLDDDVAAKLKAEARNSGRPFRAIVNEMLRRGLANRRATAERQAFRVTARDLGDLRACESLPTPSAMPESSGAG